MSFQRKQRELQYDLFWSGKYTQKVVPVKKQYKRKEKHKTVDIFNKQSYSY